MVDDYGTSPANPLPIEPADRLPLRADVVDLLRRAGVRV